MFFSQNIKMVKVRLHQNNIGTLKSVNIVSSSSKNIGLSIILFINVSSSVNLLRLSDWLYGQWFTIPNCALKTIYGQPVWISRRCFL